MPNKKMDLTFHSDLQKVRQVMNDLLEFIDMNIPGLNDCDKFDLRLIFSELLCNAVIHGNKSDASKKVHLFVEISGNIVFSSISDEGSGFNHPSMIARLNDVENLDKENGRGMMLVYSLTDSMSFNMEGSQIHFRKKVKLNG